MDSEDPSDLYTLRAEGFEAKAKTAPTEGLRNTYQALARGYRCLAQHFGKSNKKPN